ncbi:hypothetical protein B0H10DRAFT_2218766 [Mycena sp. CBHHK59/15]|nr:hypothetical protein B0H10DRAFT_2218766 [Mycena sp. CBHHK59/15]
MLTRLRWTIVQSLHGENVCIAQKGASGRRLYATNPTPRFRGPPRNIISTLDPLRLRPDDFLDMSGRTRCAVTFVHSPGGIGASLWYQSPHLPFPNGTRGFLYYHADRESPLAGTIRFRVTPDPTPASFPHGSDLRVPSGCPWQVMLAQIASPNAAYSKLRAQLLHERLATPAQLARCREVFGARRSFDAHLTLFARAQAFPVHFARAPWLVVVGPHELRTLRLDTVFKSQVNSVKAHPFSGAGLARFERSTLREHAGQRMLLLRIVKITEPVAPATRYPGRLVSPVEGQLVSVHDRYGRAEPWAYNVDRDTANGAALRLLWDM